MYFVSDPKQLTKNNYLSYSLCRHNGCAYICKRNDKRLFPVKVLSQEKERFLVEKKYSKSDPVFVDRVISIENVNKFFEIKYIECKLPVNSDPTTLENCVYAYLSPGPLHLDNLQATFALERSKCRHCYNHPLCDSFPLATIIYKKSKRSRLLDLISMPSFLIASPLPNEFLMWFWDHRENLKPLEAFRSFCYRLNSDNLHYGKHNSIYSGLLDLSGAVRGRFERNAPNNNDMLSYLMTLRRSR